MQGEKEKKLGTQKQLQEGKRCCEVTRTFITYQSLDVKDALQMQNQSILSTSVNDFVLLQMERIGYHASVAVWAGNNENELGLVGNWYGTKDNFSTYQSDSAFKPFQWDQ